MQSPTSDRLRFAEFSLDHTNEQLVGPAGPVRIGQKAFRVLWALAMAPASLLTKERLFETVWEGVFVSESALTSVIKELRQALGDDAREPRFIESVYGRGYRFIAPVEAAECAAWRSSPVAAEPGPAICVLPFDNISGEIEQEYFSDGITEDIITDLSRIAALRVLARHTAFQFKGTLVDLAAVASQFGVTHVLEGSVRKAGERLRITAQLVDTRTAAHVWAERYDRDFTDVFAIQDEISRAIVSALKLTLLPEEQRAIEQRETAVAKAYNLYLMARQLWVTGNYGDRRREDRVIRICEKALALDPAYARALALMALAQTVLHFDKGDETVPNGLEAAERALAIDPGIAEALCPLARHYAESGRFAEAEATINKALALDGQSWAVNKEAGRFYFYQRRIDDAQRHFGIAAEVVEADYHALAMFYTCAIAKGDRETQVNTARLIVTQCERALQEDPFNGSCFTLGSSSLATLGQFERGREWMERALLLDPDNISMRYNIACNYATTHNDPEAALETLESVMEIAKAPTVKHARIDTDFDELRKDPRFEAVLAAAERRLGLASP